MTKIKQDTIRKTFIISQALFDKLIELQEHIGAKTMTGAAEYAINYTYQKEINNYVNIQKQKNIQKNG